MKLVSRELCCSLLIDFTYCTIFLAYHFFLSRGIDLSKWRELQSEQGKAADLQKFVQHVRGNQCIPNTVLVDCTADSYIASHYYDWLRKGIHIITPNKKANSGPLDQVILLLLFST